MDVGVPRELKDGEYRVGLVPSGVHALVEEGSCVWVEKGAGEGAGFSDEEYAAAGAKIAEHAGEVYERAEMIVKVKEPVPEEYARMRRGQIIFTYLHLASLPELTRAGSAEVGAGLRPALGIDAVGAKGRSLREQGCATPAHFPDRGLQFSLHNSELITRSCQISIRNSEIVMHHCRATRANTRDNYGS